MRIPNDFGTGNPDVKTWLLNGGKGMVELRTCTITIKDLRRSVEWRTREHTLDWLTRPNLQLGGIDMPLRKDGFGWYLRVSEHRCIYILHTPCNYGGKREWFECPDCKRRTSVLYRDGDNFLCRKCLNLVFYTQKMNYRGLEPLLRRIKKLEDIHETKESQVRFYKGNPTKRMERYQKLVYKVGIGTRMFAPKFNQRERGGQTSATD